MRMCTSLYGKYIYIYHVHIDVFRSMQNVYRSLWKYRVYTQKCTEVYEILKKCLDTYRIWTDDYGHTEYIYRSI